MRESNQAMSEVALNLYRECLRKVLMQRGGYECQETEGSFMLSFYNCVDAVQFCILVSVANHFAVQAFPAVLSCGCINVSSQIPQPEMAEKLVNVSTIHRCCQHCSISAIQLLT